MLDAIPALLSNVEVVTTNNRGLSPDELTEMALNKIVYVGGQSHPVIRDQAEAFREQIRSVILFYMKRAVEAQNTTIANKLRAAGHEALVPLIK